MHIKTLAESFTLLKKNPILYLPDLLMATATYVLLYVIYIYTGAADYFSLVSSLESFSVDLAKGFLSENIKEIIISFIGYMVITFIFGVGVIIFKFSMIREMLSGKKISLTAAWREKKGYFWPVVLLRILVYLLSILALLLVFGIAALFYLLIFSWNNDLAILIAVVLGSILVLGLFILIKLAILFRYPIMFLKNTKNQIAILKESSLLLRKSPRYVIETGLIVFFLIIIFWAAAYSIGTLLNISMNFISTTIVVMIVSSLWSLLSMLVNITIDLWTTIYVFLRFKEKTRA